MNTENSLARLSEGKRARVVRLLASGGIRRRLMDVGFIEGAVVECLQKSPLGDPAAFLVKGTVIAIRREDSANILIEEQAF